MHKINISFDNVKASKLPITMRLRKTIATALQMQGVTVPCEINVLVTTDEGIRTINRVQRNIDKPTDVLSFPMFELEAGKLPPSWEPYTDAETGFVPLGDMAISYERVRAQAAEYGHSVKRELSYLTVHSVLHLLGYDHLDEGEQKRQMRAAEERIMAQLVLG